MNKVVLIGNLTRDPELEHLGDNGVPYCRFTLAVNRRYANKDGERRADYIAIVTWRELAALCAKWLTKGRKVGVIGSLQSRSYDGQDGLKRYVTEVVADEVEFLFPKPQENSPPGQPASERRQEQTRMGYYGETDIGDDDELPF
jgi:single-strand DNA-binding protein